MAKVFIKLNQADEIVDIGSDVFIEDLTGWIQIDAGSGDAYVHAQGNYLRGPLQDEEGNARYRYDPGDLEIYPKDPSEENPYSDLTLASKTR